MNTEEARWAKSRWSATDLDKKSIAISIHTPSFDAEGVGTLKAMQSPSGEILVDIEQREHFPPHSIRISKIKLPARLYDQIQPHPDTEFADFLLEA